MSLTRPFSSCHQNESAAWRLNSLADSVARRTKKPDVSSRHQKQFLGGFALTCAMVTAGFFRCRPRRRIILLAPGKQSKACRKTKSPRWSRRAMDICGPALATDWRVSPSGENDKFSCRPRPGGVWQRVGEHETTAGVCRRELRNPKHAGRGNEGDFFRAAQDFGAWKIGSLGLLFFSIVIFHDMTPTQS